MLWVPTKLLSEVCMLPRAVWCALVMMEVCTLTTLRGRLVVDQHPIFDCRSIAGEHSVLTVSGLHHKQ